MFVIGFTGGGKKPGYSLSPFVHRWPYMVNPWTIIVFDDMLYLNTPS